MAEKRVNRAKIGKIETAATRYKKTFQSCLKGFFKSGYQDSNLGPPAPKAREQGLYLINYQPFNEIMYNI